MAIQKIISGITGESFRTTLNDNFSQLYPILTGSVNPTDSTVGMVGQQYVNTTNGTLFICQYVSDSYTWKQIERNDLYPTIIGTTDPTLNTVALGIGQQYVNTVESGYFICTDIKSGIYIWTIINNDFVLTTKVLSEVPTINTISDGVGQLYFATSVNSLYICKEIDSINNQYVWKLLSQEDLVKQVILSDTQPTEQRINDYWFKIIT